MWRAPSEAHHDHMIYLPHTLAQQLVADHQRELERWASDRRLARHLRRSHHRARPATPVTTVTPVAPATPLPTREPAAAGDHHTPAAA